MDDAKRRALIRAKATKKTDDDAPPVTGPSNPSAKRKTQPKVDRQAKKAKVSLEPVVGLMAGPPKTATPIKHGVGKGLMKGPSKDQEKLPVLLREDSKHALEQISSIISAEDYEDLGNHSTEAMGETGLFAITQVRQLVYFTNANYIFFAHSSFHNYYCYYLLGNGHDEGADGTVPQP